ncbi:MAG: DUF2878 domain-containing protein [Lentisphaeraceae bacterium]|nr:DUF2878 domain-containing protein [Lentisphaeraceae bacterium]
MSSRQKFKLVNAVLFQLGWLVCIFSSSLNSLIVTSVIIIYHLKSVKNRADEFKFILPVAIYGYLLDNSLMILGYIDLSFAKASTIYLVCVWLLFVMTLRNSMSFFMNTPVKAFLLGLLAPVSYFTVHNLGKVKYSEPLIHSIFIHALLWSFFMLIVHKLYFGQNIQLQDER